MAAPGIVSPWLTRGMTNGRYHSQWKHGRYTTAATHAPAAIGARARRLDLGIGS